MNTPFFEAKAWAIATEVVRRTPQSLTLLESKGADGSYIIHSVVPPNATGWQKAYDGRTIDINRHGTSISRPGGDFLRIWPKQFES
jgi:hypothetical protein